MRPNPSLLYYCIQIDLGKEVVTGERTRIQSIVQNWWSHKIIARQKGRNVVKEQVY